MWNAGRVLLGRGQGGFQYSRTFLDAAEAQIPVALFAGRVLTFSQHFPRASSVRRYGGRISYYIDAPFAALVSGRGLDLRLPGRIREEALALERENYQQADRIVCMAQWAADAVMELCGVPREKVSVVLPGANIERPIDFKFVPMPGRPGVDRPLVLGFVGKDWKRKGLEFLLQVRDVVVAQGLMCVVHAAGFDPATSPTHEGLKAVGFIDKQREPERFIEFVCQCDLGCLFSSREALGISTLEFLRFGVPVAGFSIEGLRDTLFPGCSFAFDVGTTAKSVADDMVRTFSNGAATEALRNAAILRSETVTWSKTILGFDALSVGKTRKRTLPVPSRL